MAVAQAPWTMRLVALLAMFSVATSTQRARPTRGPGDVHRYNGHRGVHHHNASLTTDCAGDFSNYHLVCDGLAWADGNCAFVANTGGGSCSTWCAAYGTTCYAAANDAWVGGVQVCEGEDAAHGRPGVPKTQSYCDATYAGQLCVCDTGGAAATPAPPSTATATGDPHLQNIHGQRFDLMRPGHVELINIPRGGPVDRALFAVQADARRLGGDCADLYFQTVNVTGTWADEVRAGGMTFTAGEARDETPQIAGWTSFGPLKLKVTRGHTSQGIKYLNVYVKNLGLTEAAVGGLLGEDDFVEATKPDIMCKNSVSLAKLTKTAPSRSAATVVS